MAAIASLNESATRSITSDVATSGHCNTCTAGDHCDGVAQVSELINSSKLTDDDRLRLVMLFALKYERDGRPQVGSMLRWGPADSNFTACLALQS